MLVTFKTKAYSDITMFAPVALTLLKMMGHSATIPGAILAEDIPLALSRLTSAIDSEKTQQPAEDHNSDEPEISMTHRSLPLINLLKAAAKADCNIMWE